MSLFAARRLRSLATYYAWRSFITARSSSKCESTQSRISCSSFSSECWSSVSCRRASDTKLGASHLGNHNTTGRSPSSWCSLISSRDGKYIVMANGGFGMSPRSPGPVYAANLVPICRQDGDGGGEAVEVVFSSDGADFSVAEEAGGGDGTEDFGEGGSVVVGFSEESSASAVA